MPFITENIILTKSFTDKVLGLRHSRSSLASIWQILFINIALIFPSYADEIEIYIRDDVYVDYLKFLNGRDVLSISDFTSKSIRRDVVDMIIAQQALRIGGFEHKFIYVPGKLNFRNTKMLQHGKLLISFDSYWLSDASAISSDIYISNPVIQQGEYIAGIYTSPKNKKVLSVKSIEDLSTLSAVSTRKWRTDWETLRALPLKKLVEEDEWLSMARMVDIQWIDFMLMPFNSTPDQSFTLEKIALVPVKGIGVELKDSRHFVISKKASSWCSSV